MENSYCNDTICRTCMSEGQNLQSIFEYEGLSKLRISEILMATVPQLHIQPGVDKLPVLMCGECLKKLTIAYHYQQLCIQTDKRLKAMLVHDGGEADCDQQQHDEERMDRETKIEILMPEEFDIDPLVPNDDTFLALNDSCSNVVNEAECDEFLYSGAVDTKETTMATTAKEDGNYLPACTFSDCNETFVDEIEKSDKFYHFNGLYPCLVCNKTFDSSFLLHRHTVVHSITRPYQCDICKSRFTTGNQLKQHKATHSNAESANKEALSDSYQCPHCPRRFEKSESLSAHFRSHRRENPHQIFQCKYCPKQFLKYRRLTIHARIHPENQKFKCHLCENKFAISSDLKNHLEKHTGVKKSVCIQRDKGNTCSPTSAKRHNSDHNVAMLVHDAEDADVVQQQQKNVDLMDIETKEIEILLPKELAIDPLLHNNYSLHTNCIKIETGTDCEEFLDSGEGKDELCKAITNDKAPTATEEDGINVAACTSHDQTDETGVNEIEKPDVRYRGKGHCPCLVCHKKFDTPFLLSRHSVVHSMTRPYECDICKYRFTTENLMKRHKATHSNAASANTETPPDGYKCPDCPRRFEKSESLSAHFRLHRRANPHQIFQCKYCPKQFSKFGRLTQHARIHPENHKFKCHLCEKTFALNSHLKNHLEKHIGLKKKEMKFVCVHCDKAFQNNRSLNEHMNTHTGEKPHLCQQCGKDFRQLSCLRQHQLRHSKEKRYHCQECPSKFFCHSDLSKHMSVHRTTNPHTCDICGSSFSRSYVLNKHKQIHSGERPYKCVECNMSFVFIGSMRRHMRTHTGQKPYQCKYCDRAYSASGDLTKHLRSHVGKNTYICDECPKAFKYIKQLQLHKMQHFKEKHLELETATAAVSSATATKESSSITPTAIEVLLTTTEGHTTASIGVVI